MSCTSIYFQKTHEQWQTFFFISGCLGGAGGIAFLLCGSGEVQTWARVPGYKSATTSADYSTQSSMQSIDSISKSQKKLSLYNTVIPNSPTHYATLDERKISHGLTRSVSDDVNKRYSVHSNVFSYDDPYYFRSLDRKESQKKLLASNPSYHSLEYPSRRLTKSFDIEGNQTNRSLKGKSLHEDAIAEILSNNSEENVDNDSINSTPKVRSKSITGNRNKKISVGKNDQEPHLPSSDISCASTKRNDQNSSTNNRKKKQRKISGQSKTSVCENPPNSVVGKRSRKISTVTRPTLIQDDPPSVDKPSSSSADSAKKSRKQSRKPSKTSLNAMQSKDLYDKMSESKV